MVDGKLFYTDPIPNITPKAYWRRHGARLKAHEERIAASIKHQEPEREERREDVQRRLRVSPKRFK